MKKKSIALLLALVLVFGVAVGGTIAWLTAESDTVVNTFTTSGISIKLEETGATKNNTSGMYEKSFQMIPGWTISKDPKVTVLKDSEDCFLFVKLEKSENFDTYMTYTMADGWTQLMNGTTPVSGVYYREVPKNTTVAQDFDVLKDNKVTVKTSVTETQMDALTANTYPTLTVTAYASQMYQSSGSKFTAYNAWTNAQPTT